MMWLVVLWFVVLGAVAGLWLVLNLSPSVRSNLQHRLDPEEEKSQVGRLKSQSHSPAGSGPLPGVAVICPGRNEAEHLPATLAELCEQDYPDHVVVFVDDDSDDATPGITAELAERYPRLKVVRHEGAPPAGWVGKCWAVKQGYDALREMENDPDAADRAGETSGGGGGQWVCFTDADIHWTPALLGRAMELARQRDADVVALMPRLVFGSAIEGIVQMQLVLALGIFYPMDKAMDPDHPDTLTGGAFMLVRRSLYDAIGGHEAVKGQVVEDLHLGRALKAAGGRIRVAMAPGLMWCRMYEGWKDMWEGLTKNAYAGLGYAWWRLALMVVCVMGANVLPPLYLLASLGWLIARPGWAGGAAVALSAAIVLLTARVVNGVRKIVGLPAGYAWTMPVGSAVYLAILLESARRYYFGGNLWKGRAYGPAHTDHR